MITLTKYNAKERCRTCLCKLLKDEEKTNNDVSFVKSYLNKFVDIKSNNEVQELLEKYVFMDSGIDLCNDESYPQYVCMVCFNLLKEFEIFRNKALVSAKKLHSVFNANSNLQKIELNDDTLECKENGIVERDCVKDDIFNLFLKDSLMETEAIILHGPDNNNDFKSTDPDPFQNTQNQEKLRKPRSRRTKEKSRFSVSSKLNCRKSKKNNTADESEIAQETKVKVVQQNKKSCLDESCDLQDSTFQDISGDDNSSDNEVLSNKILHSDTKTKERNKFRICKVNLDNPEFIIERHDEEDLKENLGTSLTFKETQYLETIKTEADYDNETSTDTEFNKKTDSIKLNLEKKKKRHYILNSGRKKGLANRYKCDQCQHKFGHKLTLEAHVRKVHEGQKKAFKCQLCDKAYSFIGGLSTHIRDVHERKQDSYDCNVPGCDKKYSNLITLQRHVRLKHLNIETTHQYVCEQCGATFKQSSNLRYHMKTRHPTEEDLKRKELLPKDRLECEECKKSFHSQYTLKYHKLRVHADEKKFECKICGRRVAKQFMLDSHMLVHSDQKVACKFCGREFVRKYQVEAHIRAVHQKLKPFQCPHCSESFASRKTLRHHVYIHTGEKPYVCEICGQAYRQPTCLKNHRKIHTKLGTNNASASALSSNRNFLNNFAENNDDAFANGEEN